MKLRILIFDDDPSIRKMLQVALTAKGHEVTTHADPTEFPFFNEKQCPCPQEEPCADILIADIVMPHVEGLEFFKTLKSHGCLAIKSGNVAIMSGFLTIHYTQELNDMGIQFFRKPFKLDEIFDWVNQCEEKMAKSKGS